MTAAQASSKDRDKEDFPMHLTRHAYTRVQQRGISPLVIDLIRQFGSSEPAGDGCCKLFFDKQARKRLRPYAGPLANLLNDHLDAYIVVGADDRVITAAHRTERIRRK